MIEYLKAQFSEYCDQCEVISVEGDAAWFRFWFDMGDGAEYIDLKLYITAEVWKETGNWLKERLDKFFSRIRRRAVYQLLRSRIYDDLENSLEPF